MDNVQNILDSLDQTQKLAASSTEGPVLIIAGAGSGKTRVLTSRIAYLIASGKTTPERILALTFTKKAASEMKERVALMVGERQARRLYMGTFHSVFIRFLREFAGILGYPADFTIYDTSDSESALKHIVKDMKLDEKIYKPKDVHSRISSAKNNLVTDSAYEANDKAKDNDFRSGKPCIHLIYSAYQKLLKQAGVMDFDDILLNMNLLLYSDKEAYKSISERFDYVLVDEYQDTNFAQYNILRKLTEEKKNVCVVGDDSQSIYAFRGAKIQNILNFQRDYPNSKLFRLECNYRSTKNIVDAANSLIAKNENRIPKTCFSHGDSGEKIHLIRAFNEQDEAISIASLIVSKMQKYHCQYQDFAILYRTNAQSRVLEEALRKRNLPYMIYSGNSFYDRLEVKDMMAYLKLCVNNNDNESFRRIINKPARGIGDTTVDALLRAASEASLPLMSAIGLENLADYGLRPAAISKLRAFKEMITQASAQLQTRDASVIVSLMAGKSGLYQFYHDDKSIESQSRAGNIEEVKNSAKRYVEDRQYEMKEALMEERGLSDISEISDDELPLVTLGDYLENISLQSAVDVADEEDGNNKIALMTVHSAKGLEFAHVFVAGMEENLFPSANPMSTYAEIEEERRLFYVAITRAQTSLELSFVNNRMRNGRHENNSPSRFLREIDSKFIENPLVSISDIPEQRPSLRFGGSSPTSSWTKIKSSVSTPPSRLKPASAITKPPKAADDKDFGPLPPGSLKPGTRIEHNRFGYGTVLRLEGERNNPKAIIDFDDYGEKTLLLAYAKMRQA